MRHVALLGIVLGALAWPSLVLAHETSDEQRLPTIGPAPEIALTSQEGTEVTLEALRGKVVVVTFIYTWCPDICPMLTDKLAHVQDELGPDFATKVAFLSITMDPERDTPEVLRDYAEAFGANFSGWKFLTGTAAAIDDVTRRYGVFAAKRLDGSVDHTLLTTLIDRQGMMRVQYIGYRFNPEEFRQDLLHLMDEP